VPSPVRRARAHRAAIEQFHLRGLTNTKHRSGVLIFAFGPRTIRAVTHLDVTRDQCARVRLGEDGKFSVSDETVRAGGFAFLNADSREEAVELCKSFLKVAGPGTCEIRQILEFAPQPQVA